MIDEIKQKRHDWWQKALKSSLTFISYGTCHKCGKYRPGFIISYPDGTFSCIICRAEELFPYTPVLG